MLTAANGPAHSQLDVRTLLSVLSFLRPDTSREHPQRDTQVARETNRIELRETAQARSEILTQRGEKWLAEYSKAVPCARGAYAICTFDRPFVLFRDCATRHGIRDDIDIAFDQPRSSAFTGAKSGSPTRGSRCVCAPAFHSGDLSCRLRTPGWRNVLRRFARLPVRRRIKFLAHRHRRSASRSFRAVEGSRCTGTIRGWRSLRLL